MSDPSLSEALADAYASAPSDTVLIHTLSIYYAGLLVDGQPSEIYIYNGFTGDEDLPDGGYTKQFRIEDGARANAGAVVDAIACPFDIILPNVASQQTVKGQLQVDGVGSELSGPLMEAVALGSGIEITYRPYLTGLELDGPQMLPPIVFTLTNVQLTLTRVSGDISVANIGMRRFPGDSYRAAQFPALTY